MSITSQYASTINTSDLRDDDRHHRTDILAAVALSSLLGPILLRAKYGLSESAIKKLCAVWREITAKRAKRGGWLEQSVAVADASLKHWLDDVCQKCHGRGHPVIEGTPNLDDVICFDCGGSGKKKLRCDADIMDYVRDGIQSLESLANEASHNAQRKMK